MCSFTLYSWFLVKIDLLINLAYDYVGTLGATSHPKRQRDTTTSFVTIEKKVAGEFLESF